MINPNGGQWDAEKDVEDLFAAMEHTMEHHYDEIMSPATTAQADQFKAYAANILDDMIKMAREHHENPDGCEDVGMCIGGTNMMASFLMMRRDSRSILVALWTAVDRLARLPEREVTGVDQLS